MTNKNGNSEAKLSNGRFAAERKLRIVYRHLKSAAVTSRVWLLATAHILLFSLAYWAAYQLRFEFDIPAEWLVVFWSTLPWLLALKVCTDLVIYIGGLINCLLNTQAMVVKTQTMVVNTQTIDNGCDVIHYYK